MQDPKYEKSQSICPPLASHVSRTLDTGHPFSKSLVMGIALASNIGGMTSPISSPQNIFAIDEMKAGGVEPTWLQWFAIALPVAILGERDRGEIRARGSGLPRFR